jgi:hypothetical protein
MAIDDRVGIELKYAREEIEEQKYLPNVAARLGLSAAAASVLANLPFFSQIVTALVAGGATRFEERFLKLAEALEQQQRRIVEKIPDADYYSSSEFQSLLILILERLHSTHQEEKLRTFGEALANSGSEDFVAEDKEQYVRTLRDMSLEDIHTLRKAEEFNKLPSHLRKLGIMKHDNPSLARLAGLGLVLESTKLRDFSLSIPTLPISRQTPEGYARGMADVFKKYFEKAPLQTYTLSKFGQRFLRFIEKSKANDTSS